MRNTTVSARPRPQADIEQICLRDAREYVTAAVGAAIERAHDAGVDPSEAAIRDAEIQALIQLVSGVMALHAELSARLARVEHRGFFARLRRWWGRA